MAWPTDKGDLFILSFCRPSQIRAMTFDAEFGRHAQYKSLYTKKESLEAIAALTRAGFTLAVASNQSGIARGLFDQDALDLHLDPAVEEVLGGRRRAGERQDPEGGKKPGGEATEG